ncbi:hypothetical protein VIGAN_07184000 [Vigna angularis var. angularis]|uniref:Uncharacterized protein n=1 Tax=Vigna angularis var. angularis TaxID=157739 RepID=A0A0S3SJB7_PHAAN|nr:hypothetical protein VIGAN_07184000 [Vigna angularis var. angularis]
MAKVLTKASFVSSLLGSSHRHHRRGTVPDSRSFVSGVGGLLLFAAASHHFDGNLSRPLLSKLKFHGASTPSSIAVQVEVSLF